MHNNEVVFRRQKNTQLGMYLYLYLYLSPINLLTKEICLHLFPLADEDRATRRVSYLKATWGERIHVDSDLELSDSEPITHTSRR